MQMIINLPTAQFTQLATQSIDFGDALDQGNTDVLTHIATDNGEIDVVSLRDTEGNSISFHHDATHTTCDA